MNRVSGVVVVLLSLTAAPQAATSAAAIVENRDFVAQLYRDLLGRPPDSVGLGLLVDLLDRGTSRADIAAAILSTDEYRTKLIQGLYGALLNRPASPTEVGNLVAMLKAGATDEQAIAIIVGSPEYFHVHGDSDASFLKGLFEDLLGRPIDSDALEFYQRRLDGGSSREDVALAILQSDDYRMALVGRYFASYLLPRPTSAESVAFTNLLKDGATDEDVAAMILGLDEYFLNVAPTMRDLCKARSWRKFAYPPFRNQGQCVSSLGRLEL